MPRPTETPNIVGVSTHNNMRAEDGSKKLFCVGCGGPRDVAFAETNACGCCGSFGTQKYQPEFDEFDQLIPADVVAARRAAAALVRAELKAAEPVDEPAPKKPIGKVREAAKPAKSVPAVKPVTAKARKQAAASTLASLF